MNMNEYIPFHRPFPLPEYDQKEISKKIMECFETGQLSNGIYCRELEDKIKKMYHVDYCLATSNCTMGLFLCYLHHDYLSPIHLPTFTWFSTNVITTKFYKQFHDIDINTWLMKTIPSHGVVSPVHTFGNICEIKQKDREVIIYDGAHSLGSKINEIGDATVFSFAPTKLITSCEGGIIATNDKKLSIFAEEKRHQICRMSEPHAIIGLATLNYINEMMSWKKKVHDYYEDNILGAFQEIPITSNYNTIGFLNEERLKIPEHIETKQYYIPVNRPYMFPVSSYVYQNIVCLPSFFNCPYKEIVDDILEVNGL